ncbi:hypothetical protein [Polyangium sp. 6x1]|uniref:hypothetical protein n=1 Tax=Polyangium sp. 6x1 TaxID=3042689 RepID=UPI002482DEEB|nr:hypothetical protein [Polyangium sp. 6x1]MDI1443844.1 hypothetical protein [Polyangium sp. 6x1]
MMERRIERIVTAVVGEIERGLAIALQRGGEPHAGQQVESFEEESDASLSRLWPTHFECMIDMPRNRAAPAERVTLKVWGEFERSGAPRLEGVAFVEPGFAG